MTDSIQFLEFGSGLPGDFNGDGVVDAADYTIWRNAAGGCGDGLEGSDRLAAGPDDPLGLIVIVCMRDITDGTSNTLMLMHGADDGQWRVGGFSEVSGLGAEITVAEAAVWRDAAIAQAGGVSGRVAEWWDDMLGDGYFKIPDLAGESLSA